MSTLKMNNQSDSMAKLWIQRGLGIFNEAIDVKASLIRYGPLGDLKASIVCSGPFDIALTVKPFEHLTFVRHDVYGRSHKRETLQVMKLERIFELYRLQFMGLATYSSWTLKANCVLARAASRLSLSNC